MGGGWGRGMFLRTFIKVEGWGVVGVFWVGYKFFVAEAA